MVECFLVVFFLESNFFSSYFLQFQVFLNSEIVSAEQSPLKYRRISDLLIELDNAGLVVSRAYSRGRRGYGKEYKLKVDPNLVGPSVNKEFYDSLVQQKEKLDAMEEHQKP